MRLIRILLPGVLFFALVTAGLAKPMTNAEELRRIALSEKQRHALLRGPAYQQLKLMNRAKGVTPDGRRYELVGVEPGGRRLYLITDNINAAKTISTFNLLPGGISNMDLDGSGTSANQLAVWDGGSILTTHTELVGRVTIVDSVAVIDHATHVAGTMIASGIDLNARGMSPAAELSSYDWNNDTDEMAAAAINGLQVSNHSYGYIRGWSYGDYDGTHTGYYWFGDVTVSDTEDYMFGFYSSETRVIDQIAYNAPYYLIVKSAGNDRGDNIPSSEVQHFFMDSQGNWVIGTGNGGRERDGGLDGFDCIGDVGTAKNILTVGAEKDLLNGYHSTLDLRLSTLESYSGFGPSDDGRVKPDILGNGQELYSTLSGNNWAYGYFSGTSMASPNVSGSINLLLRLFESTHHDTMRSATIKAFVIHTADDDGISKGPDYRFGWGLMNTTSAVDLIVQDTTDTMTISEHVLMDGDAHAWAFSCDGTQPLKITIVWTDPPGIVGLDRLNNRSSKLVNDLDIWVAGPNDELYYPWTLDPDHPSLAAVRDKPNHVDNVEQVVVDTPAVGQYTAYIMHDGTLSSGEQAYSMIVTGANGDVQVTSAPDHAKLIMPSQFDILGSYPNPFNPATTVRIALPENGNLSVMVYNVLGKQVATLMDGVQSAGVHSYLFNGRNLPSGIYFVRAQSDRFGVRTHKMVLVR
ncbi:MAG: S8 family serine peptidase [bacterium]